MALCLLLTVLLASLGPQGVGARFSLHFEMGARFWMGALYGYCRQRPWDTGPTAWLSLAIGLTALLAFLALGPRGAERTAMLMAAAGLVHLALRVSGGAKLTDRTGDLSYGVYIFAFPVQQVLAYVSQGRGWSFGASLALSLLATGVLAFASWHLVEKQALRFKPRGRVAS
jgi:peptidoglycan/LPS O-acetylase OafA/YrhL